MKYGETLRQRSIPAWSHYNIDYDDIKLFIKDRTTPGAGKTVSIPGRGDDKLVDFEQSLFHIFADQHQRIDLFVKSKAGEIRRRLDHAKKQFRQLSMRRSSATERKGSMPGLDRYVRLENDVVKAGDELRSLARFTSTQRTAFRKLLKKYKKWTGSDILETRVRDEILDDPKSFTQLDFAPMLDEYSDTLHDIRTLYETTFSRNDQDKATSGAQPAAAKASPIERLSEKLRSNSKADFDVAFDTIPLGEDATLASYFVHPDNIIELQVLLLRHFRSFASRSRPNSDAEPPVSSLKKTTSTSNLTSDPDYFLLAADNPDRFAQEQASVTVDERERGAGVMPQKAKVCIRWNSEEEAIVSAKNGRRRVKMTAMKKKYADSFFDRSANFSERKVSFPNEAANDLEAVRNEVLKDNSIKPLYRIATSRSRHIGIANDSTQFVLATLDTDITMRKVDNSITSDFPFALLQVRQEGNPGVDVLSLLDQNHLVERVRGFSLQYHALWQICKPATISPPFWMPILSRDIRKLPPPALPHESSNGSIIAPSSPSAATQHSSANSAMGITDSTTAVETTRQSSFNDTATSVDKYTSSSSKVEVPTLRAAMRRSQHRRRPQYADPPLPESPPPQQRYWSEYDHPEDGSDDGGYVIYIDPNERSSLEKLFDKLASFFGSSSSRRRLDEEEGVVGGQGAAEQGFIAEHVGPGASPIEERTSSSDDEDESEDEPEDERAPLVRSRTANSHRLNGAGTAHYGTLGANTDSTFTNNSDNNRRASLLRLSSSRFSATSAGAAAAHQHQLDLRQQQQQLQYSQRQAAITPTCLTASLIIIVVAGFLAGTSRRKFVREVDVAVFLAIVSSLLFALVGFAALFRRVQVETVGIVTWCVAGAVVVVDAVVAGALVAWMVG